jgi:DNA-binding transcriptional MerR regulator
MEKAGNRFFLVSEAGRALGVASATIRDWEREGRIQAARTQGGFRIFTDVEIARVRAEREAQAAE